MTTPWVQSDLIRGCVIEDLVAHVRGTADGVELECAREGRGEDGVPYINIAFRASSPVAGWSRLRSMYAASDLRLQLATSTIMTCEGDHGWEDYLLLFHFDSNERLDNPST